MSDPVPDPWRAFILATAALHPGIGPLQESLKWREPGFTKLVRKVGSPVRPGQRKSGSVALLFIRLTGLVDRFRAI